MADGGCGGCYFHPKQVVVGVCPLCLHDRLLTLLPSSSSSNQRHQSSPSPAKSIISLFALPSLLNPLHFLRHSASTFDHHPDTSTSQEDSFISIKFEGNGGGSWEDKNINVSNNKVQVVSLDHHLPTTKHKLKLKEGKSVAKSRGSLRWRRRIGQVLQLIRWKKKKKSNVEGVKVMRKHKHGWITSLTKRKTK